MTSTDYFSQEGRVETARAIAWLLTLLALILLIGPFLVEIFPIHHIILVALRLSY